MRNIFFEKLYRKCGGETSPRTFSRKSNWANLGSTVWDFIQFVFIVCPSRGLPKYIASKMLTTCFYFIKLFWKTKRGLGLVSLPHFRHDFWGKIFLRSYSFSWPNFIVLLPLLLGILGNICFAIICFPVYGIIDFESELSSLIGLLSYMTKYVRAKNLNILRMKIAFKIK